MTEQRELPLEGVARDTVLERLAEAGAKDADWRGGKVWSLVYFAGDEHHAFLKEAHATFFSENGLNPMAFKSLQRLEREVVRMSASMLHGPADAVGTMTSGGTESLLLVVKAARDRARKRRPWIRNPEVVLPETAHVAFDKACHYFGVKPRWAPVGPDYRVDLKAYRKLVNRNTVLLVASAPQYPHGVVDPIVELGEIAQAKKLPFHVDACIGGFVLPFLEDNGHPVPLWDFRVPGVTSISADLHKYGYAAKGASVVVYRNMDYLKHQFFVSTNWPGGIYASPSIAGTRPGGSIAAAWAALMAMGRDGYRAHARDALEASQRLQTGIRAIPGLDVVGKPDATLVAWHSIDPAIDIYAVADQLEEKGWHIDRQQHPESIHCTVTSHHLGVVDTYLADIRAAVELVRANPELKRKGNAAMYGMMAKVPVRMAVKKAVEQVMTSMYGPNGGAPDPTAGLDGPVAKLMERWGPQAMNVLDRLDAARKKLGLRPGR